MEWRRRESNPHPKVATKGIYTFSQFAFFLACEKSANRQDLFTDKPGLNFAHTCRRRV